MKTYEIKLLTPDGIKTEIYTTTEPLENFENRMIQKYKTFITQTSKQI